MQESYIVHTTEDIKYPDIHGVIEEVKNNGKKIAYILHCLDNQIIGREDVNVIISLLEKV